MRRSPFEDLEELLERMSDQVEEGMTGGTRSVPVDVRETDDAFLALIDLPGYDAADVELTVTDQQLRVEADRETATETDGHESEDDGDSDDTTPRYVRRERTRTSVSRTIRLPEPVDEAAVSATLDDGVLTVTLPKQHEEEGRTIEIDD
jgi:HSP20 family protein